MKIKFLWLSVTWLWGCTALTAQLRMEALTVADGLSQGFVTSIIQDHRGFIWIATFDGLNRYDGYTIRRFPAKPFDPWALHASQINCLYEDKRHLIWVGTHQGLYVFDPLKERFLSLSKPVLDLPASYVSHITGDGEGNVFVFVAMEGNASTLVKLQVPADFATQVAQNTNPLSGISMTVVAATEPLRAPIRMLEYIGDSMLLVVDSTHRVFRYADREKRLQLFNPLRLPRNPVSQEHNILWGKSVGYFFRWQLPNGRDSLLPFDAWSKVLRLSDNNIGVWLSDYGPFLKKNDRAPLSINLEEPPEKLIQLPGFHKAFTLLLEDNKNWNNKLIADRQGIVWIGTRGYGVRKMNAQQLAFGGLLEGKSIAAIRELPNGQIWVRFYNNENTFIDAATGKVLKAPPEIASAIHRLYEVHVDRSGNFWLIEPRVMAKDALNRLILL